MALRGRRSVSVPRYCAEHRHDLPSFERANRSIGSLDHYEECLAFDKPNLTRATKLGLSSLSAAALTGPAAFYMAPAIGGALGTAVGGYSGAVASSYGLALLGGGSIASGGFGMAGGTAVVAAIGSGLGGALGSSVVNAYIQEDKSFRIERLQQGSGTPVVLCSGFLTESSERWGNWKELVQDRYPNSPVYRVHWGAKELKDLGIFVGAGAARTVTFAAIKKSARRATRATTKKLNPAGPVLLVADAAKNPWWVAKQRANKTGTIVADLIARTDAPSYVLIGHSLGARAMLAATEALATKIEAPRVAALHLLGAAVEACNPEAGFAKAADVVYNYHSRNDKVLGRLYRVAEGGERAAGLNGLSHTSDTIQNVDVTEQVDGHREYVANVQLR